MLVIGRSRLVPALLALVAALGPAGPARSAPTDAARIPGTVLPAPAPSAEPAPDRRLREIVRLIDEARARAAAPGLRDEERDALAELAWAQVDESLGDPVLRERSRRDPDFLQVQALLLMDDGDDEEALAVLGRLQTLAPGDPETHRLLALVFMGLGRARDAVDEYRRALALGGGEGDVRAHLAYALAVAGSLEEALAESARAIGEDPAGYLGHFVRGWILGELGRGGEARAEYLAAVQREQDDADLWALLAESWEAAGRHDRSREAWREVLRIDPSDEEAAEKLGATP